tara:strand:- start:6042 stop:6779 length:738 start_codon:yes stop_codon:yes gene_type:complete
MRAIILAAGVARRLYPITLKQPKCMLEVFGQPLINYQIKALKKVGVNKVTVVTGYLSEIIVNHLNKTFSDMEINYLDNPHFFETNTSYSLNLCRKELSETDCLLMNADVLYPIELIRRIISDSRENILAVETKLCGREEVKVIEGKNQRIVAIGKELIEENCLGEFIGVAKISRSFGRSFADSLSRLIKAGGKADYFEAALHPILSECEVYFIDISDLKCIEIDFIEDLKKANKLASSGLFEDQR